jgi:signal transduction histidine kinase
LNPRSLGLLGMRERANYLGGTFEIKGAPGRGTFVKVSIPIVQEP